MVGAPVTETLVAQLAREPIPGAVKTRLLPKLRPEEAAALHARMVDHTCRMLCNSALADVQLWIDGDPGHPLFESLTQVGIKDLRIQCEGDLGQRMEAIVDSALAEGYERVVLVGSDAPTLTPDYVECAIDQLATHPVVFGPALDGGYVLLGLSQSRPELFRDMPWGTERVLDISLQRMKSAGISCAVLEPRADIDRPEDLCHLPSELGSWGVRR